MSKKFSDISVEEWKKLSEEDQKNFKEVIKQSFLGFNKVTMENKAEEARSKRLQEKKNEQNMKVMSGIWKQSKITSTAIKVVSNNWGKILGLAIFLLPKTFWVNLKDTIFRVYNFFKGKTLSKIWSDFVDKNLGKVVAGIGILTTMFAPKAAFMVAMAGFKTLMLGFKGMKWAGNKIIGGPQQQGPVRPAGTGTTGTTGTKTTTPIPKKTPAQIQAEKKAKDLQLKQQRENLNTHKKKQDALKRVRGSRMTPMIGAAGRLLGWVGIAMAAGDAINEGFFSPKTAGKTFGEKISATLGKFASNMTLGLVDAEWTENLLNNIGDTITDGIKNGATSLTQGIIKGLDFIRNFDWDREVKRFRDARKDPAKEKKGEESDTNEILDILDGSGNVSVEQKARLKKRMDKKAKAAGIETEVKVDSDEIQKEKYRKQIARLEKEKAELSKKFGSGKGKAVDIRSYKQTSKRLSEAKSNLKNFGVGPGNAPVGAMGPMSAPGNTAPIKTENVKPTEAEIDDTDNKTAEKMPPSWDRRSKAKVDTLLHSGFQGQVKKLVGGMWTQHGIDVGVTSATRGRAEQNALKKRGVSKAEFGKSLHNYGAAIDVHFNTHGPGGIYDGPWNKLSSMGKGLGMRWGGDWKNFQDKPHFQIPYNYKEAAEQGLALAAAKGFHGMVKKPTVFLTGEAGPEMVHITPMHEPTDKMTAFNNLQNQNLDAQRMGGSGGGTTVIAPQTTKVSQSSTTAVLSNPTAKDTFWNDA